MEHAARVLFLDQFGAVGGGQRILLDLISAMREVGWSAALLCPQGPLVAEAEKRGAQVHVIALPDMRSGRKSLASFFRGWIAARRIVRTHRPRAQGVDLIIVNGPRTIAIARAWVLALQKPALLYLHGLFGAIENLIIRSFLRLPRTAAVAASPIIADSFASVPNVHCIHNWVSSEFLTGPAVAGRLRQSLSIVDRDPIILVPGRFSPNKGQLLALEASALLADVPCHFVFAGAPLFEEAGREVERRLREAAAARKDRIHILHWQEFLPTLYDGADLVLVPSVWEEPFGLTAIEAMARSRPLIVTDRGMLPRLADGGTIAHIAPANPKTIADAIRAFVTHRGEWRARADESKKYVEAQYHPATQCSAVIRLCESLLTP